MQLSAQAGMFSRRSLEPLGGSLGEGKGNGRRPAPKSHLQPTKRRLRSGGKIGNGLLMGGKAEGGRHAHTHAHIYYPS